MTPESIFRLSPAQEGMLFDSLAAVEPGAYVLQVSWELRGALDPGALRRAWRRLMARHPILRASFHWQELDHPVQVVHREAELPWAEEDWRGRCPEAQRSVFTAWLEEDRRRGFDLEEAPLLRLALFRVGDDRWWLTASNHHLILDGWSQPVVLREVAALFAEERGGPRALLPRPRSFAEAVTWMRGQDPGEAFWRRTLAGIHAPTPLAVDWVPGLPMGEADEVTLHAPEELTAGLAGLARAGRLTPSTLVHAAWALLLARRSGEEDVVFGSVASGRPPHLAVEESLIGMLINTLPARVRTGADRPLTDWLAEVQADLLDLQAHAHSPLVEVQKWSEIPRGLPLFESLVAYESYPRGEVAPPGGGLTIAPLESHETTPYPLVLSAEPGPRMLLALGFDRARFGRAAATTILGQLATLLAGMVEDPNRRPLDLPLLTAAERGQVIAEHRGPEGPIPDERVDERFAAWAERTPDAPALLWKGGSLTYAELAARVRDLADRLREMGVRPEVPVAVPGDRSPDWIVAMLAVARAGGVYVPLDPSWPEERRRFILEDSGAGDLTPCPPLPSPFHPPPGEGGRMRSDLPELAKQPQPRPPSPGDREGGRWERGPGGEDSGLAYLIYTSGTTGRPKGVMVTHRALSNLVLAQNDAMDVGPGDRVLAFSSPAFDSSVWEIWTPLAAGAALCIADGPDLLPGPGLARLLREQRITHLVLPPSALALLPEEDFPDLRVVSPGGEALAPDLARRWGCRKRLLNGYGPTEATVQVTLGEIGDEPGRPPIGQPLPNVLTCIVGPGLCLLPAGLPGELWLGGPGLARGYLKRPDLTAERFLPDPFSGLAGERLYRTGDLVRMRPDGQLDFLGRIDGQIKIRGFRVEPEEIEAVLREHSGVREAAVVRTGDRLAAFVTPAEAPGREGLRGFLAARLPDYMLPAAFVPIDALPQTSTGKIDRRALAEMAGAQPLASTVRVAPRTPVEGGLARIWAEVLEVPEVGAGDDFFELGGHSLLVTRVVSRVEETFGVELPIRALFEARTLAAVAARIEEALGAPLRPAVPLVPVPRNVLEGGLPLSFAQQRLWFIERFEPGIPVYILPTAVRLHGRVDVAALRCALSDLVRRHESLRTRFPEREGGPVQEIDAPYPVPLPVVDLSGLPDEEVEERIDEEAGRAFDLAQGPVLRAVLIGEVLLLTLHHIVTDGWSMGVLLRELGALYTAHATGALPDLPPLPVQYADYAVWQRAWLTGEILETQLGWWKDALAGFPAALDLPLDHSRPPVRTSRGGQRPLDIPPDVVAGLRRAAGAEGGTLFMALLAGLAALLARHAGQDRVVIGSPVAGRRRPELEGLIGFFVNTLALPVDLQGEPSFRDLLGRVREVSLGAYAHQDLPFERLVDELRPDRDPSRAPLFQALLAFDTTPLPASLTLPGLDLEPVAAGAPSAPFDLTLELGEEEGTLAGRLLYSADLFDATTAERLAGRFVRLLAGALAEPDRPLAEMHVWSEAERHQLLLEWNDSRSDQVPSLEELLATPVERTPDARAVVFADGSWTYRELHRRASELAVHLRRLGVGPEVRVGVCLESSPELIVGMLATWQAGGVFLPLDPNYPQERLDFLLEDAKPAVLLGGGAPLPLGVGGGGRAGEGSGEGDLAYLIYTSGSTGRPKGALIRRGALARYAAFQQRAFGATPESRVFQLASPSFDAAILEILLALTSGGELHLAPRNTALPGPDLARLLRDRAITHLVIPPSALAVMPEGDFPALTYLIVVGEPCPSALARRWAAGRRLINGYGPTETTIITAAATIEDFAVERLPVGYPVDGAQMYVLDRALRSLPAGVPGELCLGGALLGRGYLDRPDLTAGRFVPDPFGAAGSRLYRTGDLARHRPDGRVELQGRIDRQVKLRGFRIEPGEIEAALASCPQVREAAVVVQDGPGGRRLVAFVAPTGEAFDPGTLRAFLKERLPEPLIPAAFLRLDALPLTPNGKVDRRSLEALRPEAEASAGRGFADPILELVAGVWSDLLGVADVGPEDDFFELGGHSLLATRVVSRLRGRLGVDLPLRELFEASTLADFAERVRAARRSDEPAPPIVPVPRGEEVPLSFAQQRLWFLDQLRPGDPSYNMPYALELEGKLDVAALAGAIAELVRRHELTPWPSPAGAVGISPGFQSRESGVPPNPRSPARGDRNPAGEPLPPLPGLVDGDGLAFPGLKARANSGRPCGADVLLPQVDLSAIPDPRRRMEARNLSAQEALRPFDLRQGPLLRATLLRLDGSPLAPDPLPAPPGPLPAPPDPWPALPDPWPALPDSLPAPPDPWPAPPDPLSAPQDLLPVPPDPWRAPQDSWPAPQDHWRRRPGVEILLLTLHHIVADGWSLAILVRELGALYTAFASGQPSPLPEPRLRYADYAVWQRRWLSGAALERQVSWWKTALAGAPSVLDLPTDRPRRPIRRARGGSRTASLPAETARALRTFCQREGATLFMGLFAAWGCLLARHAGQREVVIGSPIANRERPELEGIVGFFVNTLALRLDLRGGPGFRSLLGRAREMTLGAYAHQDLPFERLVDELELERDLSRTPLFQVALALQNTPFEPLELPGLTLRPVEVEEKTAKFDLNLNLSDDSGEIAGILEYDADLFDPTTADRLVARLGVLLAAALEDPELSVLDLPLWTSAERQQLLFEWNAPAGETGRVLCLHELFEEHARRTPGAVAVVCEGERITYADLDARAERLAHRLRAEGVGPEVLVGLAAERSTGLIAGILGILKAGGAYVPLDPAYPAERLELLLADSGAPVLVTTQDLLDDPPGSAGVPPASNQKLRAGRPRSQGVAYVIYTSGSTGRPKGVPVSHANVVHLLEASRAAFGFGPADVWTLFHSFAFDFSVWEIWGALAFGGRLVIVPHWVSRSPDRLWELLVAEGVTVLNQTPSAFQQLIPVARTAAPDLRLVIFGGEALEITALAPWFERFGDRRPRMVNMYGITESTVHVTMRTIGVDDIARLASVVGRALDHLRVRLFDERLQPVPVGVPGELCVGGAGLARGYLGRPDLTAERFVPDRFTEGGGRLYRSGDLARWRPDGDLEYLGRIDHQVKVRGFRIEPGEIEATLLRYPGVRQAAVVLREGPGGSKRLVAFVAGDAEPDGLRESLRSTLPEPLIPAAFVSLDALPLTSHGKVDRKALARRELSDAPASAPGILPRTPIEEVLAAVWSEVLEVERIGIDDNFFALGGDSILSLRARARAAERGLDFTLQQLFERQTIRELARILEGGAGEAEVRTLPFSLVSAEDRASLPEGLEDAFPLSSLQTGLVFHSGLGRDWLVYLNSFHLRGPLDLEALRRAIARLIERHPMFRTSFAMTGFGEPLQLVWPAAPVPLTVEDLSALSAEEQEAHIKAWTEEELVRPFDWPRPPLLRFHVHIRSRETWQLSVSEPFLDGWSVMSALAELFQEYLGSAPLAPPPTASYRDFVALERASLGSPEHRAFWDRTLEGATAAPLAPGRGEGTNQIAFRPVRLPAEVGEGLARLATSEALPLKSVLLAAHLKALGAATGRTDVISGLLANGRPEVPDGDRVLGIFLNSLPFRLHLAGGSWAELARRAFVAERELLPFRRFPLAELQRRHGHLFDTLFNYTHFHVTRGLAGLPGLELLDFNASEQTYFALTAHFDRDPDSGQLGLMLIHDAALLRPDEVERLAGLYERVLAALAADPAGAHDAFCPLSAVERHQILIEWNDTGPGTRGDRLLHDLFFAQAEKTPEAVALICGEERLSYRDLADRALRIAEDLRERGVGPEVRVGVCLERTPELIATLLGVLAAGGAYVPLDPAWPEERLELIQKDAQLALVLNREHLAEGPGEKPQRGFGIKPGVSTPGQRPNFVSSPEGAPEGDVPASLRDLGNQMASSPGVETPGFMPAPPAGALPLHTSDAGLAYVLYTSGSTGRPKGVAVRHLSAVALLDWAAGVFGPDDLAGVLAATSVCFDLSVFEIFLPLSRGGTVILARDALALPGLPAAADVRLINTVPSALAELLRAGAVPPGVRTINLAGEPLPRSVAEAVWALDPRPRLFNLYGPSEDTTYSTAALVEPGEGAPPIGRPIAGTRAYVLDASLQPVLPGAPGELCLAGEGLARGYFDRPDRTAESFVPDPFAGGRMYRTGDLARHRPDGALEFLGRIDAQVKVRGFRIEPGEIEAALESHPAVERALVVARARGEGDKRLVAYVVLNDRRATLSAWLAARLPAQMVPSAFVVLDTFPLTPSGKIDRAALPAPEQLEGSHRPPRTPVEETLAGLWDEVLGTVRVGLDDDFFELGGHSLLALRLTSRVRDTFRTELPVQDVFAGRTLERLAQRIEAALREGVPLPPPLVADPEEKGKPAPLTFAQQRLWFLDRLDPGSPAYHIATALRLEGDLDLPALVRALGEVVRRHEALRTRFVTVDGEPFQVVDPPAAFLLPVVDLGALEDPEAEVQRLAREEARRPFDLARGPVLRGMLVRDVLLLTFHHIAADGWSLDIFARELATLYAAFRAGQWPPLPRLPVQIADYARWQRRWLTDEVLASQLAWWRERLAEDPGPLALPADRPRPARPSLRGAQWPFRLDPSLTEDLRALGRRHGATLFMTLLAGFQAVLHRWSGQPLIRTGTPVANRGRTEIEGLIGFFVNTLVLQTSLAGDPPVAGLLGRVREAALGAYAHGDLPFERLVDALCPDRDLSRAPLFQAMLAFQTATGGGEDLPDLAVKRLDVDRGTSQIDLTLSLEETDDGVSGVLEYATDLFDAPTAGRLAGHLENWLHGAAASPGSLISELPWLSSGERHQVEVEWAEGAGLELLPGRVHDWIAAQAPEAPAVIWAGGRLTYGDLDERAERLAGELRRRGVGPEVPVAICVERSPEMIAAILAVLKAGGAYVPIDPAWPAERRDLVLEDSGAEILLGPGSAGVSPALHEIVVGAAPGRRDAGAPRGGTAYLIYTSGSTGRPKGVAVTHANLAWSTAARLAWYPEPPSAFVLLPSFAFDSSVAVIFWTLSAGGALVLPPEPAHADLPLLARLMTESRASHWLGVPSLWSLALEELGPAALAGLRAVIVAGEACPRRLAERHAALVPGVTLYNEYGPTEATVWCTVHRATPEDVTPVLPIGRAIPGSRVEVLDRGLRPVPIGVPGELWVGGPGVAGGYLGRPDLTAERFAPDPRDGGRRYRTGDLVRRLADGRLEFLGRLDEQVKVRGFRIEPGEIEEALLEIPGVRRAAVVAAGTMGDLRLAAFWVAAEGASLDTAALRQALAQRLPDPMIPSAFARLDALPLTPNGKVDRQALADRAAAVERAAEDHTGPRDGLELRLGRIFEELLGVAPGVHDDFFILGGHSLLAVRLMARIERELGRALPLAALFQAPTVARLAEALREAPSSGPGCPLVLLRTPQGKAETPMFWVHPIGGTVLCYRELAQELGGERAIWALEAPGVEEGEPLSTVEALAGLYIDAIRAVRPSGPYLLGGWSFGGLVALEMARLLEKAGEEVPLVALVDTSTPGLDARLPEEDFLAALAQETGDEVRARRLLQVAVAHLRAQSTYSGRPVPQGAVLFRAADPPAGTPRDVRRGWESFPGRLETVPGDHYSLWRDPHVRQLAERIRACLREAGAVQTET